MTPQTTILLQALNMAFGFGTFFILIVVGYFVFESGNDVAVKRKWLQRSLVLGGVIIVSCVSMDKLLLGQSRESIRTIFMGGPFVGFLCYVVLKSTKICHPCGKMIQVRSAFGTVNYCQYCGARIDAKPKSEDGFLE